MGRPRLLARLRRAPVEAPRSAQPPPLFADRRTRALGALAVLAAGGLIAVEVRRVWRLGEIGRDRGIEPGKAGRGFAGRALAVARSGYQVSSTRDNVVFNVLLSFVWTFAWTRVITTSIRRRGRLGPIKNVRMGDRHIHHFLPGIVISTVAGGTAIIAQRPEWSRRLAIPFGGGVALVLDETALLLELQDVYWSEEGVVSVQVAFVTIAVLVLLAYAKRTMSAGETRIREEDWLTAARAWDDLQLLGR